MRPLALVSFRCLGPHLAHPLEYHIHVSVEGLHSSHNLAIVATVNQHLGVSLHCLSQQRQRALMESVLLRRVLLFVSHCCNMYI